MDSFIGLHRVSVALCIKIYHLVIYIIKFSFLALIYSEVTNKYLCGCAGNNDVIMKMSQIIHSCSYIRLIDNVILHGATL